MQSCRKLLNGLDIAAGAVLHAGGTAQQAKQEAAPATKSREKEGSRAQSRSDTSQLAHYYQQAAAQDQGTTQDPGLPLVTC